MKQIGEYEVDDYGISKIEKVIDEKHYITRCIMPKEVFIEAYNKYIGDKTKIILNNIRDEVKEASSRIEFGSNGTTIPYINPNSVFHIIDKYKE